MKDIEDNIYGNQCGSDNAFTRKARLLQSMYSVEIGEEEGVGPIKASKQNMGTWLVGWGVRKELPDEGGFRVRQEKSGQEK